MLYLIPKFYKTYCETKNIYHIVEKCQRSKKKYIFNKTPNKLKKVSIAYNYEYIKNYTLFTN